ncbi:hypothetical protein G9A89_002273 [Geosiphon pyriformis]|nr:hypothetical protein G9A89_002273 [Geosiphon pyriformis]
MKKFDGVQIFTSGLEKGFLKAGMAVIMNECLAQHVSKDKILIFVVGLYAGASTESRFSQVSVVNSFIVKAVNFSTFVVLGGDFNENRKGKSASVKFCSDLGLIKRTIDFIFVSCNLSFAVAGHEIGSVVKFFNTDYRAVSKFKIKDANAGKWLCFREYLFDKFAIVLPKFNLAKNLRDLDTIWNILKETVVMSADKIFSKYWFSDFVCMKNKYFSKFFRLELLVTKIVKSLSLSCTVDFAHFLHTWSSFDKTEASEFETLINNNIGTKVALQHLAGVRKKYHKSKYYESRMARDNFIRKAIDKHIKNFSSDKGCIIRSVLDQPVRKVVLDHLIVDDNLILDPHDMKKCMVSKVLSDYWSTQYAPLAYVDSSAFMGIMSDFSLDELLVVVNDLLDGKAAGLSDITNELWKHYNKRKRAWVSIIPKPYEWKGTLTNIRPIALIETAYKGDNFSVLKGTSTLSLIFAVGSVVKDALEKGRKIKMCSCFVKFFKNIHNGQVNCVMTDFELTSGYTVHDKLDQGERIFYDPLLCEIKKFEYAYGYRIEFRFFTCIGKPNFGFSKMSFMAAGAFVDDIIWIRNSLIAIQSILNIASEFFCVNDILINVNKTVAIPINKRVANSRLVISKSNITIAKKCETYRYLDIFLSTERLSHPSIVKAHLDLKFFTNLVLRKVVSDKQFLYLVSVVLQSIISYRLQFSHVPISVYEKWDKLLRKGLKLKANLPKNFLTEAFYYPGLYNMVPFRQLLAKNSLANFVSFANSVGILGDLFKHCAIDLQTVKLFLAGIMNTLSFCSLFLGSSATNMFHVSSGVAAADVFGLDVYIKINTFHRWKRLDLRGPTSGWFVSLVEFIESGGLVGGSNLSYLLSFKFFLYNTGYIRDCLRQVDSNVIPIYTDSLVKDFGSFGVSGGTAAYFPSADIGVSIRIPGLLSSMLAEMQAITLALNCVPSHSSVVLFTDNYVGVIGNERADFFAGAITGSSFVFSVKMSHHFLSIKDRPLSGNAHHMARKLYEAVNLVGWEFKYVSGMVNESLSSLIDKHHTFDIWHADGQVRYDYTMLPEVFGLFSVMLLILICCEFTFSGYG